jgi:hypothetical protein
LYQASLAQAKRQGDLRRIGNNLLNLIMTAIAQGRTAGVQELLLESVAVNQETLSLRAYPLILCAGLAALRGDWERSARFEGAARFQVAQLGWPLEATDKAFVESFSARTRAALGDLAFERSLALGQELSVEEAVAQMLQYLAEER